MNHMTKRDRILKDFLKNKEFADLSGLSEKDIDRVTFSSEENNPVVIALRRLILSYSDSSPQQTIINTVNTALQMHLRGKQQ